MILNSGPRLVRSEEADMFSGVLLARELEGRGRVLLPGPKYKSSLITTERGEGEPESS